MRLVGIELDWKEIEKEILQDHDICKEYQSIKPMYDAYSKLITICAKFNITLAELARRFGLEESDLEPDSNPCAMEKIAMILNHILKQIDNMPKSNNNRAGQLAGVV